MLLLSSPRRSGRQLRASPPPLLPLFAAVLLCVVSVGAALPAGSKCPHHIDCAKEGRHFCRRGSSHCGPCISPLQENEEGRCMERRHRQHGAYYPELDEEIDYLQSVIEKQEVSEIKPLKRPVATTSQADVKKYKTSDSRHKQKSQALPSTESPQNSTTTPGPTGSTPPNTPTPQPRLTGAEGRAGPIVVPAPKNDKVIIIIISLCVVVGTVAVILATVCFVKLQRESHLAQKVDYPAFRGPGVPPTTAATATTGDKTLAQSAQMYHYQHQKQQMLSMGNHKPEQKVLDNEVTSDEEEVGGDFTVYECPGLAPSITRKKFKPDSTMVLRPVLDL
ncbi:hypothetical protein INR49_015143 [Caranx melampygus]|nr:hypothetical protein INR49_015143 [Caranx melampygus]